MQFIMFQVQSIRANHLVNHRVGYMEWVEIRFCGFLEMYRTKVFLKAGWAQLIFFEHIHNFSIWDNRLVFVSDCIYGKEMVSANCEVIVTVYAADMGRSVAIFTIIIHNSETTSPEFLEKLWDDWKNSEFVTRDFRILVPPALLGIVLGVQY